MTTATQVRALTIWQPWASCIAYGTKRIENRSWPIAYRGLVLIHAGRTNDPAADEVPLTRPFLIRPQPHGAIVATAQLVDCHADDGWCSLWAARGLWHWKLSDVQRLPRPVPCLGSRGLWTPDAGILTAVREAVHRG
ncbi:hypothetical protein [Streptomyces sp. NPDC050738]|uniref:hypothetical protein n=1 Tax=Streptomyces sp. NPDC050738 TaxID=3154744 RepID=UPI003422E79F